MRVLLAVLVVAFGLAACGEREQVVEQQSEKRYQGKRDTKPWDNPSPVAELRGGTWVQGDQRSWEDQIKTRQGWQNERNPR